MCVLHVFRGERELHMATRVAPASSTTLQSETGAPLTCHQQHPQLACMFDGDDSRCRDHETSFRKPQAAPRLCGRLSQRASLSLVRAHMRAHMRCAPDVDACLHLGSASWTHGGTMARIPLLPLFSSSRFPLACVLCFPLLSLTNLIAGRQRERGERRRGQE